MDFFVLEEVDEVEIKFGDEENPWPAGLELRLGEICARLRP
jgi:hypothetical protein